MDTLSLVSYLRNKAAFDLRYPFEASRVVPLLWLVVSILRFAANPQIGAPIVRFDAVRVVNDPCIAIWNAKDKPMQQDLDPRPRTRFDHSTHISLR
jgi:hypothetical protein